MKTLLTIVIIVLCPMLCTSQERTPFYIGHSLVNFNMPAMVHGLALNAGKTTHYDCQIANGSPLHINYNDFAGAQGTPYTTAFPDGNYNSLIITEAVPLQPHLTWSDTYLYANNFYTYAKDHNNGNPLKFYIYETWHCKNSGIPQPSFPTGCDWDNTANSTTLWHPRLLADFPLWSGIVTHVRNQNPTENQIWMVPAGQAFYNLTSEINAGNIPGITTYADLFIDDIHLTNSGNYFVACVMYATIYGESPVGLSQNINDMWGVPFTSMPTVDQALAMQQIAWNTVTTLSSWTGVNTTAIPEKNTIETIVVYPNPSNDLLTIQLTQFNGNQTIQICNSIGQLIKEFEINNSTTISVSNLDPGVYFIKNINQSESIKFIKE
jgi:hypothetical protein